MSIPKVIDYSAMEQFAENVERSEDMKVPSNSFITVNDITYTPDEYVQHIFALVSMFRLLQAEIADNTAYLRKILEMSATANTLEDIIVNLEILKEDYENLENSSSWIPPYWLRGQS